MSFSALKETQRVNTYLLSFMYLQAIMPYPGDSVVSMAVLVYSVLSSFCCACKAGKMGSILVTKIEGVFLEDNSQCTEFAHTP